MVEGPRTSKAGRITGVRCRGGADLPRQGRWSSPPGRFCRLSCTRARSRPPVGARGTPRAKGSPEASDRSGSSFGGSRPARPPRLNGPDHRLHPGQEPARGRRTCPVLVPDRSDRAAAACLSRHQHHARGPRPHPCQPPSRADVLRPDREHRAEILPLDRGQGRPLRRPHRATRFFLSPKGDRPWNTTATGSRPACLATSRTRSSR